MEFIQRYAKIDGDDLQDGKGFARGPMQPLNVYRDGRVV